MRSNHNPDDSTDVAIGHQIGLLNDEFSTLSSVWRELQQLKQQISVEKRAALEAINERFAAELSNLETKYTLVLRMSI